MGPVETVLLGMAQVGGAREALRENDVRNRAANELLLDRYGTTYLHGTHEQSAQLLVSEVFPSCRQW